ncbi:major capsid protein [Romboutsia lituseburensis]|uniref:Phage major capsid protein E n=1 Tax=Romboutsia lituseburensis DSM 797 TaxID=1121325 RepID=A0A1G9TZ64_9FIRM|nr:major capsid protein [Romboutsia lituseburensis]CEH34720.1 Phage major capsid protein E [Romboutsia lituseburensis]SDM53080.1 Phage major capsid protein E [Romboutsia lituseburensis DSM 797]
MPTIYDIVKAKEIGVYYNAMQKDRAPYLGETLFPFDKKLGLDLKWIKGSKGMPVALKSSGFDTKAELRDRIGFSDVQTEMPFFKEAMLVKESDRQELNKLLGNPANQPYVDLITRNIFDDVTTLLEGALVQLERMRMQLLSEGKIAIMAKGIDGVAKPMDYDYNLSETQKVSTDWTSPTSNPVEDILKWMDDAEDRTGSRPTRAICTRKTWGYLLNNQNIQGELKALSQGNITITNQMLENYLLDKLNLRVVVNSKKYKTEAGVVTNYFKDDVFTLLPDGGLGKTWFGTTPEESDLMSGATDAEVNIVNLGIAITTTKETDPVNVKTKASMIALPSFERADEIVIANVNNPS